MTQDEFDRKMEFLVHWQAKLAAAHEVNMLEHAEFRAQLERSRREFDAKHDKLYAELVELREAWYSALDNTTQIGELMTRTFEAMDRRDARRERRLDRLERLVFGHVSDPHAHDPAQA